MADACRDAGVSCVCVGGGGSERRGRGQGVREGGWEGGERRVGDIFGFLFPLRFSGGAFYLLDSMLVLANMYTVRG